MEDDSGEERPKGAKALLSFCSSYVWDRLVSIFPLKPKLRRPATHERCIACLPLPIPFSYLYKSILVNESSGICHVLEAMLDQTFLNLRIIEDNLLFWQFRAAASNRRKLYFIICERGPLTFIDGIARLLDEPQTFAASASSYISHRVYLLSRLTQMLAAFLSQIYMEIEKCGEVLVRNPERSLSLPSLLVAPFNRIFSDLEESIRRIDPGYQDGGLHFEKLPEPNQEVVCNLTDSQVASVVSLINTNLQTLDSYLSLIVACQQKPKKISQYWIPYTCGAVGLSICSMWLLRHSSLRGSFDVGNWIRQAKDSICSFFSEHVEQPLLSIRDELLGTSTKRHGRVMEREQVEFSTDSLQRMLLECREKIKGQKFLKNAEMRETTMTLFEKPRWHLIQHLVSREFGLTLSSQAEELKIELLTLLLLLHQFRKASQIGFAVLAVFPALSLLKLIRAGFEIWDTKAQGTGRNALRHRKILLLEIEDKLACYGRCVDKKQEKEAHFMYGLVLYNLDLLSHSVRWHAQKTGEWRCLAKVIVSLARPTFPNDSKFIMIKGMNHHYRCLRYHFTFF